MEDAKNAVSDRGEESFGANEKEVARYYRTTSLLLFKSDYFIPSFLATSAGNAFLFTMKQVVL